MRWAFQCPSCGFFDADQLETCAACGELRHYIAIDQVGFTFNEIDLAALRCLAANLATAAALCAAWMRGWEACQSDWDADGPWQVWLPGCNRPAPGWMAP